MTGSPYTDEELRQLARDRLECYWRAVELADGTRRAWEEAGSPLTVVWPNGTESIAPLLRALQECERDAERFARAIPKPIGRPGRPPVAVLDVSPAAQLRKLPPPLAGRGRTGT